MVRVSTSVKETEKALSEISSASAIIGLCDRPFEATSLFLQTRDARRAYLDVNPQYGYETVPVPKEIGKLSWVQYRRSDAAGAAVGRG